MSSAVIEKELTCSICTDILFDPVIFLDCLHANCGACAKSWFASLNNSESTSNNANAGSKFTCPACRAVVREARAGGFMQNLVDDFVKNNPLKDRTQEEKKSMRSLYRPGDKVLPLDGGSSTGTGSAPPAGAPTAPRFMQSPPTPSLRTPPPIRPLGNVFRVPLVPLSTPPNSGPFLPPGSPLVPSPSSSLTSSFEQLSVTRDPECHHCSKPLKFAVRGICATCEETFCTRCYRVNEGCGSSSSPSSSSSPPHVVIFQKQRPPPQSPISFGLFCAVCESFCGDPNGNGFWLCSSCHSSGDDELWGYCSACVGRDNCCAHDLEFYAKAPRHPTSAVTQPLAMEILQQIRQHKRLVSQGQSSNTPQARLLARGYTRVTTGWTNCDFCGQRISPDSAFLHCPHCQDGDMDICMQCYEVTRSGADQNSTFKCPQGHDFSLLTQSGSPGSRKVILSPPHDPPEIIPRSRNTSPRTAVALKGHWPDEENALLGNVSRGDRPGVRMWEHGDQLAFPEGAVITDVALAFTEGVGLDRVTYYWGWYGGAGGLFEGEYVRIMG